MKPNVLAVIPARGGSKGIPNKNILPLLGKPLLAWTIEAARQSSAINRIVVSSDSEAILAVAKKYGAIPLKRPAALAADSSTSEPTLVHAIKKSSSRSYTPDFVIFLQPTSPLRTARHIDQAFKSFLSKKADALISVCEADKKFLKSFFITKQGYLGSVSDKKFPFTPRQKLPSIYLSNGAIYILKTKKFLKERTFWLGKTVPFVMSPEESIDLDSLKDLALIKKRLAARAKFKALTGHKVKKSIQS